MRLQNTGITLLLVLSSTVALRADTTSIDGYSVLRAEAGEECAVCGMRLTEEDVALVVKGRRVPLNRAMVQEFLDHQGQYFARLQPKGALFQEDMDSPPGTSLGGITWGWFLFGLHVLVALVFAGLSGFTAVTKGLKPIPFFFAGLLFSAFGYLYVVTRSRSAGSDAIPHGLVKVPETSSPVRCPKCGYSNHPSAAICQGCKASLVPALESEVLRASQQSMPKS